MNHLDKFTFRLYTAKDTHNSALAFANLVSMCKTHLMGRYTIEIIDVIKQPHRALADGIRMTPTLVKLSPRPASTIVGNLSRTERVMAALGIAAAAP